MNNKFHRLQIEFPVVRFNELDSLMVKAGLRTRKDVIENALTLFEWAVAQHEAGRMIASVDEAKGECRELLMPSLSCVKNANDKRHGRIEDADREKVSSKSSTERLTAVLA